MSDTAAQGNVKEITVEMVVLRCGCGRPAEHHGRVCPTPQTPEDLGVVSYWHQSWRKRLAYRLKQRKDRRNGNV